MIPKPHVIAIVVLFLAAAALSAGFYSRLPEQVPVHWNIAGEADRFGSRWEALLIGPAMMAAIAALLAVLPLLGPFRRNFESFRTTYGRVCVTVMAGLLAIHAIALLKGAGSELDIGRVMAVIVGTMIAVIGNWLAKLRRNFWAGIRTPWTLASDAVWERTHRLGAKLFVAAGLISAVAGLLLPGWLCFWVLMGTLLTATAIVTVYSAVIYRRVGEREETTWAGAGEERAI